MAGKHQFQMRMIGDRVAPETVRAGDLADFVSDLEAAITAIGPGLSSSVEFDEAAVSLVGIEAGSNKLTFAVTDAAIVSVGVIAAAVAGRDYTALPPRAHERLHEISKQAIRKDWAVEFVGDAEHKVVEAVISGERPVPPPTPEVVKGPTTIWGRLMRVGGARPRAEIRLPDGNLLFFDLTADLAKQLSDGLYEDVSIDGVGTWLVEGGRLADFRATRITGYRPEQSNLIRAFEELASVSNGRWDDIDAADYVGELRREDES